MTFTIDTQDPRDVRALTLAMTADQWKPISGQGIAGRAYSVPSSDGKRYYVTSAETCSCEDNARGNVCKHRRAVAIFEALRAVNEPPKPSKWAAMSEAELFARLA